MTPAAKPDFAPTNPAPAGGEPTSFTASAAQNQPSVSSTIGTAQGQGSNGFAGNVPDPPGFLGTAPDAHPLTSIQAGVDQVAAAATPDSRSESQISYDAASAARQARAGGAATFEEESAARQARAGGAATYAQESAARNERAVSSRTPGQIGPDSRDRDRTGRISKDEGRAFARGLNGMSKSSFDGGKIQSVLARLGRVLGGQKEVDRQIDHLFGSGAAARIGGTSPSEPVAAAPTVDDDVTSAIDDDATSDFDQGSRFNTGGASNGFYGFNTLNNS